MVREHGSLTKDAETNQAAWEAAKGAAYGGVKVRFCSFSFLFVCFISAWRWFARPIVQTCMKRLEMSGIEAKREKEERRGEENIHAN
jgi:hypothetical protein